MILVFFLLMFFAGVTAGAVLMALAQASDRGDDYWFDR